MLGTLILQPLISEIGERLNYCRTFIKRKGEDSRFLGDITLVILSNDLWIVYTFSGFSNEICCHRASFMQFWPECYYKVNQSSYFYVWPLKRLKNIQARVIIRTNKTLRAIDLFHFSISLPPWKTSFWDSLILVRKSSTSWTIKI